MSLDIPQSGSQQSTLGRMANDFFDNEHEDDSESVGSSISNSSLLIQADSIRQASQKSSQENGRKHKLNSKSMPSPSKGNGSKRSRRQS